MKKQYFKRNEKGKDWVVGDIHGCFSKLSEQLDAVGFDSTKGDRLFCVGDLVDRGPESELCLQWLDQPWFFTVRGNHEQMAINFVEGHNSAFLYERNGGRWFIDLDEREQVAYTAMFEELPHAIELETSHGLVGLVHAQVPDNNWHEIGHIGAHEARNTDEVMWGREKIMAADEREIRGIHHVFLGHTPLENVAVLGNASYIDTGAVFADLGKFTVLDIEEYLSNV